MVKLLEIWRRRPKVKGPSTIDPREVMTEVIRGKYGLDAPEVSSAMLKVPREEFVPAPYKEFSYSDNAIPIEAGQTISQPYTVAFMTHLLLSDENGEFRKASRRWKVLEIGTGSGYQAAVLSLLVSKVFTVERIESLAVLAKKRLKKLGYKNIDVKVGNGARGWREEAPYDAILITAAVKKVPRELVSQLKVGGVLVAPVGIKNSIMTKYTKGKGEELAEREYSGFSFVPFVEE